MLIKSDTNKISVFLSGPILFLPENFFFLSSHLYFLIKIHNSRGTVEKRQTKQFRFWGMAIIRGSGSS